MFLINSLLGCFVMKELGETQTGFRVGGVNNLPKKKNVFRETLKLLLKKCVSGVLKIAPTVSGSKKTKNISNV